MGLLWDKLKSDILKTTKVEWANWISSGVIMVSLLLVWLEYIFKPVINELEIMTLNATQSGQEVNGIIGASMLGFVFLSMWFTMTWLNFKLCRYTMRLLVFIIDQWEIINTKRSNKKKSVD